MSSSVLQIETPEVFLPLLPPARYKGAHGGRGSGKSHFFAELLVEECLVQPTRAVCVREIQKSLTQSVKLLVEDKITRLGVASRFNVMEKYIEVDNGGLIIFQGMQNHTADSIKSLEGFRIAWVEEAQSLSQRSLDLLRPTLRTPGSELWFSWNPSLATDPVDLLLRGETTPPRSTVIEANWSDNPWLPPELIEEKDYDQRRDPDKYAHIWLGQYQRNSEARVFRNWRTDAFDTPADARFFHGADWGFSVDPTVLVRCYVEGRTLYVDREVYKVGCEIDRTPALFDSLDPEAPEIARRWPVRADSARPETISYMQRHGYPKLVPATKGAGSVEDGIEFLKSYDIVVHPRCKHLVDELTLYSYKTDPLTGEVLPVLADKKNHVIDALRYAVETLRSAVHPTISPELKALAKQPRSGTFTRTLGMR
ncbi:PBSX family phage terminase large subunit [Methylobacterium organophilum]|uniref:PBSX family phage terminase large subunit n=1 Tax=Methylobacterium organophilum TaxID=410 RepID=UPI0019D1B248|nr:PBSX family phage terminase large subunit [Methylobacterium organophilum]